MTSLLKSLLVRYFIALRVWHMCFHILWLSFSRFDRSLCAYPFVRARYAVLKVVVIPYHEILMFLVWCTPLLPLEPYYPMYKAHLTLHLTFKIFLHIYNYLTINGPPRGKRDGVIRHFSERENGNWMGKFALLRDRSIWDPAWFGKLVMNMNFRQFLDVICEKNLRKSRISSPSWRAP